jgi:ABC-2 type transport system permease protein
MATQTYPTLDETVPSGSNLRWLIADTMTIAKRNIVHIRRVPEKLINVTIQPVLFVLLFAFVFGNAIPIPGGGSYREYLMAGIFTQTIAATYMSTAVGVTDDMSKGIVDRFRSLPMTPSAVLGGRSVADLIESVIALIVLVVMGLLIGWRVHNGAGDTLAALGLLLLFGYAMIWVGATLGLYARTTETATVIGFIIFFPISFVSNAFVPTSTMPSWLQPIAEWNPLSATTAACRELFGNPNPMPANSSWPMDHPIEASLLSSIVMLAIFMPLALRRYKTIASR